MRTAVATGAVAAAATSVRAEAPARRNGRIKQSLVNWCYEKHFGSLDEFCKAAVELGCVSIELIDPKHWPTLKKHGLTCAIAGSHGFKVGFANRGEWDQCLTTLRKRIDECAAAGVDRVITFTGMENGVSKDEGAKNCVEGLKKIVGYAEEKKVTLCMEHLNSRDDSHPMKGHPGYQGDHCDWCIDVLKQVGSPRAKLLFDIYHVQIMDGDVIRRLKQHREYLGHIHTAGNPGRGELDENQEINYPAVMKTLLEIGYDGYVGQEFIPTKDAMAGLRQAVGACDV
jgi:hydroxypyruvate isomerase